MAFALDKVQLFQGFSKNELDAIKPCLHEKSYQKGEVIFLEGSACERIFIVESGRVKIVRTSSSGREQILETLNPGDTCACNPGSIEWACSSTAEAVTACKVWFLSRQDYVRMVQTNSKVAHALNRLFAQRLQCFSSLIEEVSLKDTKKRLVKFIVDMLDEQKSISGKKGVLEIPFTRQEIAQRIGTARETVARHLYELKRKKLIDIKPKQIAVLDEENLRKLIS